jgi:hypothetical protein
MRLTPYEQVLRAAECSIPCLHRLGMVEGIGCGARQVRQLASGTRCSAGMARSGTAEVDQTAVAQPGYVLERTGRAVQPSSRVNIRSRSR